MGGEGFPYRTPLSKYHRLISLRSFFIDTLIVHSNELEKAIMRGSLSLDQFQFSGLRNVIYAHKRLLQGYNGRTARHRGNRNLCPGGTQRLHSFRSNANLQRSVRNLPNLNETRNGKFRWVMLIEGILVSVHESWSSVPTVR